jgi:hypothetical protein
VKPYAHELWFLLRRRAVIGVAIIAVLGALVVYVPIQSAAASVAIEASGVWYEEARTFHLEIWAYNGAGQPVSGLQVGLNVTLSTNGSSPVRPPVVYLGTRSTDLQGFVAFQIGLRSYPAKSTFQAGVNASYPQASSPSFGGVLGSAFLLSDGPSSNPVPITTPFTLVNDNFYTTETRYLVAWTGPGGVSPDGDRVVSCTLDEPFQSPTPPPTNCSGASSLEALGTLTGPVDFVPAPSTPPQPPSGYYVLQQIEIRSPSGAVLYTSGNSVGPVGPCSFGCGGVPRFTPCGGAFCGGGPGVAGSGILAEFASSLALFLPLMGFMLAYWGYARPRLSGTLESVLVRPVTRRGLFLTRYSAVALTLTFSVLGEIGILDLEVSTILHEPLPSGLLGPLLGALLVAALGFAGLVLLLAQLFRSPGPVVGIGITLLVAMSIFWTVLVSFLFVASGADTSVLAQSSAMAWSLLAAPPQFPAEVIAWLTQSGMPGGTTSPFGVSSTAIGLAGAAWIALPFLGCLALVETED